MCDVEFVAVGFRRQLVQLVYFNDDFEGGETRFTEQLEQTVVPKPGLVAVFQHKIRHEGCEVRSGTKYAMRTNVVLQAPGEIGAPNVGRVATWQV